MKTTEEPLVHYFSPFGSPAYLRRPRAERLLAEDDRRWCWLLEVEAEMGCPVLSDQQRQIGPPRIEILPR